MLFSSLAYHKTNTSILDDTELLVYSFRIGCILSYLLFIRLSPFPAFYVLLIWSIIFKCSNVVFLDFRNETCTVLTMSRFSSRSPGILAGNPKTIRFSLIFFGISGSNSISNFSFLTMKSIKGPEKYQKNYTHNLLVFIKIEPKWFDIFHAI